MLSCDPSNGEATAYDDTTTPGRALLFRKDLEHEGELLKVCTHAHTRTHAHSRCCFL